MSDPQPEWHACPKCHQMAESVTFDIDSSFGPIYTCPNGNEFRSPRMTELANRPFVDETNWALRLTVGICLTLLIVVGQAAFRGATNPPEIPAWVTE